MKTSIRLFLTVFVFALGASVAAARTLRLFVVGNSFSNNATRYLPDLAKAGGHELIMARAQTGGCSFERHWNALEADLAHPGDAKGKIYGGKSLRENLGQDANHANVAGEYLGALVWYGFLFDESPEKVAFVPSGIAPEFAAHLRQVAWQVVQETAPASRKLAAKK
mgnify:CR=1 FL=1